jgi:nuclear transport factor 2 (NTF2) superfamily protein
MTHEEARKLIEVYGKAWETKNPDLVVSIFTEDATYDDPHEPVNNGREAIRNYWITKVIGEQDNIHFSLKNIWIEAGIVIAEWDAQFDDIKRNVHIDMSEIAIFSTSDGKFSSLREYYKNVKTPL